MQIGGELTIYMYNLCIHWLEVLLLISRNWQSEVSAAEESCEHITAAAKYQLQCWNVMGSSEMVSDAQEIEVLSL